jgi:hypothetical protein
MTTPSHLRRATAIILAAVLLATTACGCNISLDQLRQRLGLAPAPTATLYPTATPAPTATLPDGAVTVEVTAEQLNDALTSQGAFQQGGLTIEDAQVAITEQEITASFRATYEDLGMTIGLVAHGVPAVIDGQLYVQVTAVDIDPSVTGFTRLVVQAAIDQMLDEYGDASGIPIPVEGVVVDRVQLAEGKLILSGHPA